MKFVELKKNIASEVLPAYLITGKDSFLRQKALEIITNAVVTENKELNSVMFSTDNLEDNRVIDACNTMPFFASHKLVVVKEYEKKKSDSLVTKLDGYLLNANPTTCLVLVAEENSKYFESLKKKMEVVDCNYLSKDMLKRWVLNTLKEKQKNIEPLALELLIDYCNYDLMKINMELYKLISLVGDEEVIKADNVKSNTHKDLEFQVYELTNALSKKDATESFLIMNTLLENKSTTSSVLAVIYKHFRRLFHASISSSDNVTLANELEVKEYAVIKARQQAKLFGVKKLKDINELIVEIDFKSKTGKMDAVKGLNYLLLTILNM